MHCINYNPYEIQTIFIGIKHRWTYTWFMDMNWGRIIFDPLYSQFYIWERRKKIFDPPSSPSISDSSNLIQTFLLPIYYSSWYGHRKDLFTMYKNSDEIKKKNNLDQNFHLKRRCEITLWRFACKLSIENDCIKLFPVALKLLFGWNLFIYFSPVYI